MLGDGLDETVHGRREFTPPTEKIIGQVQAIDRMVNEDVPCEDILAQINAAKSALHKVGRKIHGYRGRDAKKRPF